MGVAYNEYVKKPYEEYEYTVEEGQELLKCSEDFWAFLKHVKIIHPDDGRITFEPYQYQKDIFDLILNNRFVVTMVARQSGKSTLVAVYLVWYAIFHDDKRVGVVSNNEDGAIDIIDKCKLIYEELPYYLKPGATKYDVKTIGFDNGSIIRGAATSKNSFRGRAMNIIFADELAFVEPSWLADAFWMSNYPTISKSKESKFIVVSTPNGIGNLFHTLYSKAEKGTNAFKHYVADYRCLPERDNKEWADQEKSNLGSIRFNQEYGCKFLGSASTVIEEDTLKRLLDQPEAEPVMNDQGNFRKYRNPEEGFTYLIGADCAKGTGEHSSTFQVYRLNSMKPISLTQVAVFEDNKMDTYSFAELLNRTALYYNDAYLMVENNGEGAAVISELWWHHENENLVCSGSKEKNLGIRATMKTKTQAVILMKKLIEDAAMEVIDQPTIQQLLTFIEKNNKFTGDGKPDDLVSALYWMPWIFKMNILEDSMEFQKKSNDDEFWGEIFNEEDPDNEGYEVLQRW
jgi:hypothetical protein